MVKVMMFNATLNNISVIYRGCQFYWWMKRSVRRISAADLSQVTDKLYQIILYRVHLPWAGFELTMLVVICTNCKGSCKSNYQLIRSRRRPLITKEARQEQNVILTKKVKYEMIACGPMSLYSS